MVMQEASFTDITDIKYISVDSGAYAVTQTVGDFTQGMTGDMSEIVGFIESGDVRLLAVLTVERVPGLKDIPTAVEQGIDVVAVNWRGLYVPKYISDQDFNAWAARLQAVTESDDWKTAMMENGLAPFAKAGDDFQRWVYGVIASTEEPSVRLALFSNAYLGPHFRGLRDPWVVHLRDGGPGHRRAVFFLQTGLGHWVAVKCGHRRGFFTGDVQQDGRNPPAINRAVINRGEQHHRGRHIKADREGHRDLVPQHRCLSPTSCSWRRTCRWSKSSSKSSKCRPPP
jgi:hypothetical protein